jgi:hypothetical protein
MYYNLRVLFSSMWRQGLRSNYRLSYWRFLYRMVSSCRHSPAKIWMGFTVLLSAHHFVLYSKVVIEHLQEETENVERTARKPIETTASDLVQIGAVS